MPAFPYAAVRQSRVEDPGALLRAVTAEVAQDPARSCTLPPAAYYSRSFFALERQVLFEPGWISIAHVSQLGDAADCTVFLFGERVTAYRSESEIVVSAHAADGSHRRLRAEVLHGFVFANLSADASPLSAELAPLTGTLDRLNLEELVLAFRMDYQSTFNWKILVETFMECYHHAAAHPKTFQVDFPTRLAGVSEHGSLYTSGYSTAREDVETEALLTGLPLLRSDFTEYEKRSFFLYHAFPNHIIATLPDRLVWFRNQPEAPDATKLQVFMFVRPEALDLPDYAGILSREHAFFTQVNDEDIAANEAQQLGLGAAGAAPGRLSHLEHSLLHFANYVRQHVALCAPQS